MAGYDEATAAQVLHELGEFYTTLGELEPFERSRGLVRYMLSLSPEQRAALEGLWGALFDPESTLPASDTVS